MSRGRAFAKAGLALGLIGSSVALAVTDLRGRTEVHRMDSKIASADHRLERTRVQLAATRSQADTVGTAVRQIVTSQFQTQTNISSTEASIVAAEEGIFFDGIGITQLNNCLGGVTKALDQVAVGKTNDALFSLALLASYCPPTRSPGG